MDCPQCCRECGQNDKFCSECGYKLCSANTPVTGSNRHTHSKRRSHTDNRLLGCCRAFICCQCTAQDEEERSLLESENEQTDTAPAEHITPGTPAPESEYQEETTDNRSSLGPEPAPENPSLCLAQSQPSSADPAKSDAKSGLVGTDDMDGTLREDTKDTVCTAQEEEEEDEEEEEEKETLTNKKGLSTQLVRAKSTLMITPTVVTTPTPRAKATPTLVTTPTPRALATLTLGLLKMRQRYTLGSQSLFLYGIIYRPPNSSRPVTHNGQLQLNFKDMNMSGMDILIAII